MINLTLSEKYYLFSKLEYTKKKKILLTKNNLYNIFHDDNILEITENDFIEILNSLEYIFRKKLKGYDKQMNTPNFKSIQDKLPTSWIGIKYNIISNN